MRAVAVAAMLTVLAAACPCAAGSPDPRDAVVAALAGTWDNRAQYAAAPDSLKVPPAVDSDWLDLQHARFALVEAPAVGDRVLYLEWRGGGPQGGISRQRIWSFREQDGAVRMDFYAFVDGRPWAGRADEAAAFRQLALDELRGYGPGCALRFARAAGGLRGAITAEECTITAASGRRMGIDASVVLTVDGTLEYRESGRLEDGRYAFRVPPTRPYRFVRLR